MAKKRTRLGLITMMTLVMVSLGLGTGAAYAASVSGATGLIYVPSADTLAAREAASRDRWR